MPDGTLDAVDVSMADVLHELQAIRRALTSTSAELMTARQAAALLGISKASFHRLVASGQLPRGVKLGGSKRWRRADLLRAIEGL